MRRPPHILLAGIACAVVLSFGATPASAQCVDIAQGDVLIVNLTGTIPIVKVTDVSATADTNNNQQIVCTGGDILFPRSIDFDLEGRIWVSMTDGAVRVDPAAVPGTGTQLPLFGGLITPPRGIVKERPGLVFLADPGISNLGAIIAADNLNGFASDFVPVAGVGIPLGLIFDRYTPLIARDLLLSDSGTLGEIPAGLYSINEAGGVTGIARNGSIAIPFRLDSTGNDFVYMSDIGGLNDPDGLNPAMSPVTQPPQIVRIDRSIPIEFNDEDPTDEMFPDYSLNQTVVSSAGLFNTPIGIVVLEEDGIAPDVLLVSDAFAGGGSLIRVEFDPTSPTPDATDTQTVVATGLNFQTPWEVKIVSEILPQAPERIFVTQDDTLPADSGIVFVDPDGTSGDYVSNIATPNAIVIDPNDLADLIVADANAGGAPAIRRVSPAGANSGTASDISVGGLLVEPMGLIVDAAGDIIVADRGANQILRIDGGTGAQSVLAPTAVGTDFLVNPIGVGIDPDGYLQVVTEADEGDPGDETDDIGPRGIRINPVSGQQFCYAETFLPGTALVIENIQDIVFDEADGSSIFSERTITPMLRFVPNFGTIIETTSAAYDLSIRQTAVAENRDLVSVDGGTPDTPDGRLLRLDPIISANPGDPVEVLGSTGLVNPRGVAVATVPRPNPPIIDSDMDGLLDPEDNCINTANPDQIDTNATTLQGKACETTCDADRNGSVGISDFIVLVETIGNNCNTSPELDCSADCEDVPDNIVGTPDLPPLISQIGRQLDFFGGLVGVDDMNCP